MFFQVFQVKIFKRKLFHILNMAENVFLNSKDIKKILGIIKKQWGAELSRDYVFIEKKGKLNITTYDIAKLPLENLKRISSIGIYFGELKNNALRLSVEGSEIVGKKAKKNVVVLNENDTKEWLKGKDIVLNETYLNQIEQGYKGFVIVKDFEDFLGCGKIKGEQILSLLPKARTIKIE
jgi:NOL1/NOP2/fmu family ribosome biogenesis protein